VAQTSSNKHGSFNRKWNGYKQSTTLGCGIVDHSITGVQYSIPDQPVLQYPPLLRPQAVPITGR
jgi:hypothetical protein